MKFRTSSGTARSAVLIIRINSGSVYLERAWSSTLSDIGGTHTLLTKHLERNCDLFGRSFEHFLAMELRSALSYRRVREPLHFWRSTHGHEFDFIVGDRFAAEIKAKARVRERDARGLKAFQEEGAVTRHYLVSQDRVERKSEGIEYIRWETFLKRS